MVNITFSKQAYSDLRSIYGFISTDSAKYALIQVKSLLSHIEILEEFPLVGRIVPKKK